MQTDDGNTLPYIIIIISLVVALLFFSNPNEEQHLEAIKNEMSEQGTLSGVLARTFLVVDPPTYYSAGIFSCTKQNNRMTSMGMLGYVWVDIKERK